MFQYFSITFYSLNIIYIYIYIERERESATEARIVFRKGGGEAQFVKRNTGIKLNAQTGIKECGAVQTYSK